jgi:hypothetical protein
MPGDSRPSNAARRLHLDGARKAADIFPRTSNLGIGGAVFRVGQPPRKLLRLAGRKRPGVAPNEPFGGFLNRRLFLATVHRSFTSRYPFPRGAAVSRLFILYDG